MSWCIISSEAVTALLALLGAALGAGFGAFLAHRFSRKRDHLEMKRDVLRRLMGYRWQLAEGHGNREGAVFTALNEIPVVFAGHRNVEDALSTFHRSIKDGFRSEHLVALAMAVAKSAEVSHKGWTPELIESPFTPGSGYTGDE